MTPSFTVVSGAAIARALPGLRRAIYDVVRGTYELHERRFTNNPNSYFLRFPDNPSARIIALPCAIADDEPLAGIKWIASYPQNVEQNLQRASAVLVLNDYETGYPLACLEASQISAARTAASAVLGADVLAGGAVGRGTRRRIGFVGAGVISRAILDYFRAVEWPVDEIVVHDLDHASADHLRDHARGLGFAARIEPSLAGCLEASDVVVLATNAGEPYIHDTGLLRPDQIVLNVSLRDLAPEIILGAFNVFDDVEHCMKANTSPHLAEQKIGDRSFCHATIGRLLVDPIPIDRDKPLVFSPFGLGVLDLAVGRLLLDHARRTGAAHVVEDFFADPRRWVDAT